MFGFGHSKTPALIHDKTIQPDEKNIQTSEEKVESLSIEQSFQLIRKIKYGAITYNNTEIIQDFKKLQQKLDQHPHELLLKTDFKEDQGEWKSISLLQYAACIGKIFVVESLLQSLTTKELLTEALEQLNDVFKDKNKNALFMSDLRKEIEKLKSESESETRWKKKVCFLGKKELLYIKKYEDLNDVIKNLARVIADLKPPATLSFSSFRF